MLIRDLMQSDPVTLEAGDKLDLADDIMRLGRIRHMPVVSHGVLVGILSQRDLFHAAVSSVLQLRSGTEREWLAEIPVDLVMTAPAHSIGPADSVHAAVTTMLERRIGCLPVVENGKVVGIVSETDCLRALARLLESGEQPTPRPEPPKGT